MSDYIEIAEKIFDKIGGPAAVLLGIVGVGMYSILCLAKWGKPIAERVVSGHLDFLSAATESNRAVMSKIEDHDKQKFAKLEAIHEDVRELKTDVHDIHGVVLSRK